MDNIEDEPLEIRETTWATRAAVDASVTAPYWKGLVERGIPELYATMLTQTWMTLHIIE